MVKKKINWLLILQGWTMLWVVIGHSRLCDSDTIGANPFYAELLGNIAYKFHMALFMLISGFLFYKTRISNSKWNYTSIIKDKALRLVVPGLFFSILALVLKIIFAGEMSRQVTLSAEGILHGYLYPYDNPMRELWFIAALFWMFLFKPLWTIALKNVYNEVISLIIVLLVHFYHPEIELFCIHLFFKFAIYFYLGMVLAKREILDYLYTNYKFLTLFVGLLLFVLGYQSIPFIASIGGIVTSLGLSFILDTYLPSIFKSFRLYTYQIFLMGIFAQIFVKIIYNLVMMPYIVGFVVCVLAGLYIPVLVSKIIERIDCVVLLYCIGLKKGK